MEAHDFLNVIAVFHLVLLCCAVLSFIALFNCECQDCEHLMLILIHNIHIFITASALFILITWLFEIEM